MRDTDSATEKTGKVAVRAVLFLPTFFVSEIAIRTIEQNEQRATEQQRYGDWVQSLSPDQQEREWDRQSAERRAALQALGMGLMGGGPIRHMPTPRFNPAANGPMNCWSTPAGASIMMQCR